MEDIVKRLRNQSRYRWATSVATAYEAADEIERLREEIKYLEISVDNS